MRNKKIWILLIVGSTLILSAQVNRSGSNKTSRPQSTSSSSSSTQTFRDGKGRVTGTATTTTTSTGSKVTTYQTATGKTVTSSTQFPKEGVGTTVQKNYYPNTTETKPQKPMSDLVLSPEKKTDDKKE